MIVRHVFSGKYQFTSKKYVGIEKMPYGGSRDTQEEVGWHLEIPGH